MGTPDSLPAASHRAAPARAAGWRQCGPARGPLHVRTGGPVPVIGIGTKRRLPPGRAGLLQGIHRSRPNRSSSSAKTRLTGDVAPSPRSKRAMRSRMAASQARSTSESASGSPLARTRRTSVNRSSTGRAQASRTSSSNLLTAPRCQPSPALSCPFSVPCGPAPAAGYPALSVGVSRAKTAGRKLNDTRRTSARSGPGLGLAGLERQSGRPTP